MTARTLPRLEGKVVVVTGGGRNIGKAEALLFASLGARLVINDLGGGGTGDGSDPGVAQAVVDEIRAAGGEAVAETSSIASMEGGRRLIAAAMDAFGRIDVLSNNAGVVRPNRIEDLSEDDWDIVHNVTLKGYFATIRAAAPIMMAQKSGIIVNKGSASGFGHYGQSNYAAAKEGVAGLTRSVARELGPFGVRCNMIRPLAAMSQMGTPALYAIMKHVQEDLFMPALWNRWLEPSPIPMTAENVAALTAWLCLDTASEVNGRDFFIAGGEVGLFAEPELQRSAYNVEGWSLEALMEPRKIDYLIGDVTNRFRGAV